MDPKMLQTRGTTNVAWVVSDGVLLGCDSRSTVRIAMGDGSQTAYTDETVKFEHITPSVLVAMSGDKEGSRDTFDYIRDTLEARAISQKASATDVCDIWSQRDTPADAKDSALIVAGWGDTGPLCYKLADSGPKSASTHRDRKRQHITTYTTSGSGSLFASYVLERMFTRYGNKPDDEGPKIMMNALFFAALNNAGTGGNLTVLSVKKEEIKVELSTNVLELYKGFYGTSFPMPVIPTVPYVYDSSQTETFFHFSKIDYRVLWLFYKSSHYIGRPILARMLSKYEIHTWGHPLTLLHAEYYMHRLVLKGEKECEEFFQGAKTLSARDMTNINFSSEPKLFRCYRSHQHTMNKPIYVARQSLELLKSLKVEEVGPNADEVRAGLALYMTGSRLGQPRRPPQAKDRKERKMFVAM